MHRCEVRRESDVDWVVGRVSLGDPVVVQVGGLRRPRRDVLKPRVALCQLEARLGAVGGQLQIDLCDNPIRRAIRGRMALGLPGDGPDPAGVREPRRPPPPPRVMGAMRPLPSDPR